MRRIFIVGAVATLVLSFSVFERANAAPPLINAQGRLSSNGQPITNDTLSVIFSIYDSETGGTVVWSETNNHLIVSNGQFNVLLGSINPLDDSVFAGDSRWLGIKVGNDVEMSPRSRLVSVAYAQRIATVDGATGGVVTGSLSIKGKTGSKARVSLDGALWAVGASGTIYVNEYANGNDPSIWFKNDSTAKDWLFIENDTGLMSIVCRDGHGVLEVKGQSGYKVDLQVDGTTQTSVLEITGGSDVAEPFEVTGGGDFLPGSVLIIDEKHPGKLKLSNKEYDTRVAGIISGAGGVKPGLTLSQSGALDGAVKVALSGRVYVWATNANGAIKPGDMLTTSELPGYAMKATDSKRNNGAIIGKAMTALCNTSGLVLVLVSLQ